MAAHWTPNNMLSPDSTFPSLPFTLSHTRVFLNCTLTLDFWSHSFVRLFAGRMRPSSWLHQLSEQQCRWCNAHGHHQHRSLSFSVWRVSPIGPLCTSITLPFSAGLLLNVLTSSLCCSRCSQAPLFKYLHLIFYKFFLNCWWSFLLGDWNYHYYYKLTLFVCVIQMDNIYLSRVHCCCEHWCHPRCHHDAPLFLSTVAHYIAISRILPLTGCKVESWKHLLILKLLI